jgi:hypothetical protein
MMVSHVLQNTTMKLIPLLSKEWVYNLFWKRTKIVIVGWTCGLRV